MGADTAETTWSAGPKAWSNNARAVFNVLLEAGSLTRGEIAELTTLSRVTASGVVEQLIRRGFVEYAGAVPSSGGGPNSRAYSLVRNAAYVVGVASYLDRVVVAAATITGEIVAESTAPTGPVADTLSLTHELILKCLRRGWRSGAGWWRPCHRPIGGCRRAVSA